jgi:hypothetical protein
MPATFGATTQGGTVPSGGYLRSSSKKESVETFPYRNASGVTTELLPGNMKTTEVTIEFHGDAALGSVTAGAFTGGTLKLVSAKVSQSNEGAPEGTHTYKSYGDI